MNSPDTDRLDDWLSQLLELEGTERARLLTQIERDDPASHRDLVQLLAAQSDFDRHVAPAHAPLREAIDLAMRDQLLQPDQRIGPWRLLQRIGDGGMGEVWQAERADGQFEKTVAIKFLDLALRRSVLVERFQRERQILARLQHPHIARFLDAGVHQGQVPYLVMEWIDGMDILSHAEQQRLGWRPRLELIVQAGSALAHAHSELVVHRDLKPANILVDSRGQLMLLDFGIAKLIDPDLGGGDATQLTVDSGRVFTPAYAAPEQIAGARVTVGTDVYGLAAVAYELLSGVRVKADDQTLSFRRRAQLFLNENIPQDLEVVLRKALRPEVTERYASVQAFIDDVRAVLDTRAVSAKQGDRGYRWRKFIARHRWPLALIALGASAMVLSAVMYVRQAREIARQGALAAQERDLARSNAKQLDVALEYSSILLGQLPSMPEQAGAQQQKALLERGQQLLLTEVPDVDGARLRAAEVLVGLHHKAGDSKAAAQLLQTILNGDFGAMGAPQRRGKLCQLGAALSEIGAFDEAAARFDQAKQISITDTREHQLSDALCDLSRGMMLGKSGQPEVGLQLREQATRRVEQVAGDDYASMAFAYNELATSYVLNARFDGAKDLMQKALRLLQANGLARSSDAATLVGGVALCLERLGRPQEAEQYHREAIQMLRERQSSPGTLGNRLINYGTMLEKLERNDAALTVLEEGLGLIEQHMGTNNMFYSNGVMSISKIKARHGEFAAFENLHQQAVASMAAQGLADHPFSVGLLLNETEVALMQGDAPRAEAIARRAIAKVPADDPRHRRPFCGAHLLLIDALNAQAKQREANALLQQFQAVFEADAGTDELVRARWQLRVLESSVKPDPAPTAALHALLEQRLGAAHSLSLRAQHLLNKTQK